MNNIGFFGFIGWSAVCNWLSNFPSFQGLKPPARKSCVQFFCFLPEHVAEIRPTIHWHILPCKCRVCPVRGRVFVFQGHVATICLTLTRKPGNAERGWVKNLWDGSKLQAVLMSKAREPKWTQCFDPARMGATRCSQATLGHSSENFRIQYVYSFIMFYILQICASYIYKDIVLYFIRCTCIYIYRD